MIAFWLRQRFPLSLFLPTAVILSLAANGTPAVPSTVLVGALGALLLLLEFRIWDDLADRNHDKAAHPERMLTSAASVAPMAGFCVSVGIANFAVAALTSGAAALLVLAGIHSILAIHYNRRRGRSRLGAHVVLSKYAGFVLVLGAGRVGATPLRILFAAMLTHVAACCYEAWHDPSSPLAPRPQRSYTPIVPVEPGQGIGRSQ